MKGERLNKLTPPLHNRKHTTGCVYIYILRSISYMPEYTYKISDINKSISVARICSVGNGMAQCGAWCEMIFSECAVLWWPLYSLTPSAIMSHILFAMSNEDIELVSRSNSRNSLVVSFPKPDITALQYITNTDERRTNR